MDNVEEEVPYDQMVRKEAIVTTIEVLMGNGYEYQGMLGMGAFGAVIQLQHCTQREQIAAKIVLQECVTEGEEELWLELDHENIVCLNDACCIPEAGTYVFLMDKHPATLSDMLENPTFKNGRNSLQRAVSYLHETCKGVKYLHDRSLAHLDLKINNVLVSETDVAKVCDFGALTQTEGATNNYISPFISRAPEALITENGHRVTVDAFKYDIYTLGIIALDLFTKEARCKSFKGACDDSNLSWTNDLYPKIFDVLEKKKFKKLVKQTFENAMVRGETLEIMRDFIRGCLSLNPQDRPSIDEVLQHRIFGGPNLFPKKTNDVWIEKASNKKVRFLLSLYIGRAASLGMPNSSLKEEESKIVSQPNDNFDPQGPVEVNHTSSKEQKDVDNTKCDRVLNERRKVSMWFAEKMSGVTKVLNRFFPVFRRSRK